MRCPNGVSTQRFAKAAHLCPVRVWRHLPSDTFHTLIVLSYDPLTTCDGSVGLNWTQVTFQLPFSQLSDFQLTSLRLSPGERGKETKVPVAFQRRLARAQVHVPDHERLVPGCRHDGVAFGRKLARPDDITAVVLKCQGTHM